MTGVRSTFTALALVAGGAAPGAQDRTIDLLRLLSSTAGAPGFEEPIRKVMVDLTRVSWNRVTSWLQGLERLQWAP